VTDSARLVDVIRGFRGRRVLALCDLVVDEFINGRVERVSREAPVLILKYDGTDARLGGGANAVHNIKTLGGAPIPLGVVGPDASGKALRAALRAKRIDARFVFSAQGYLTPVKTRILGGGTHQAKQQIVRIDKATTLESAQARRRVLKALQGFSGPLDAVLVSDYGFGLVVDGQGAPLAEARVWFFALDGMVSGPLREPFSGQFGVGTPAARKSRFETSLSIAIADPTYPVPV
jgi:rfaE bifunctional protein kinase chain/domain